MSQVAGATAAAVEAASKVAADLTTTIEVAQWAHPHSRLAAVHGGRAMCPAWTATNIPILIIVGPLEAVMDVEAGVTDTPLAVIAKAHTRAST